MTPADEGGIIRRRYSFPPNRQELHVACLEEHKMGDVEIEEMIRQADQHNVEEHPRILSMAIDWTDFPRAIQEDSVWLHRTPRFEHTLEGVPRWELEKAVSKAVSDPSQEEAQKFTRVFRVCSSSINVPRKPRPKRGSPMRHVFSNRMCCKKAIISTFRIRMAFKEDNEVKRYFGTAFKLSSTVSLTAGHCILGMQHEDEKVKVKLKEVCGCSHNPSLSEDFEKSSGNRFGLSCLIQGTSWSEEQSIQGLHKNGSDIAFLRQESCCDGALLLPCSPRYHGVGKDVAVCSFPDVQTFLHFACIDLESKEDSKTWSAYKPAMAVMIAQSVRQMANNLSVSEDAIFGSKQLYAEACMDPKKDLLKHLKATFGKFPSGMMLASIGTLILEEGNDSCIGTTVSLLGGSSGAAICPLQVSGYFIGVHSGGSPGFGVNIGTSTDCRDLYVNYVQKVLPTLPLPDSKFWSGIDLGPFFDWLFRHRHVIPADSPWLKAAKMCKEIKKQPTSRKRPRHT